MSSPLVIVGAVVAAAGALLHFLAGRAANRASLITTTETTRLGDIASLVAEVQADLPGSEASGYAEYCELKGKLVSDDPVRGELSGQEVAIYDAKVQRVVETRHETENDEGRVTVRWRKSSHTLSSNRREAAFYLDDGSGRARVITAGAELKLDKIVDRFEPPGAVERGDEGQIALSVGSFSFSVSGSTDHHDRRTLGYKFEERVLPLDREVYVLGEVADTSDGLVLRKPPEKDQPFVLSLKTEAELAQASVSSAKRRRTAAIALAVAGIALAVIGLLQ